MPDIDTGHERARIDKGLTGEKIAVSDPAAAPMETDSESGGAPMPTGRLWLAPPHSLTELTWRTPRPETFGAWRQPGQDHARLGARLLIWGIVLVGLGIGAGFFGLM